MSNVSNLVRQYFTAYETKNKKTLDVLLSENFQFNSPVDDHINKKAYLQRCWPSSKHIQAYDIQNLLADGNEAVIRYECWLKSGTSYRNMEYFKIVGDKIEEIDVYFGYDLRKEFFSSAEGGNDG